ncbi:MAG TPA: transporter suffix domain-containing protein [Candidatus Saccharimonadia bacterium]|nr:transporter suffix domain-containing protein [Candidatus Saccharimonadia bacterium]
MDTSPKLPAKARIGATLLGLAIVGWAGCLLVPLLPLPHRGQLSVGLLVVAETSFVVGLALLGKTYYRQLRQRLAKLLARKPS